MQPRATIALLAVCAVCLALPDSAQAGFGRRGSAQSSPRSSSGSSSSSSSSRSEPSHSQPSFSSGGFGRSSSSHRDDRSSRSVRDDSRRDHSGWGSGHRHRRYPRSWGYPVWGYGFGYVPSYNVVTPAPLIVDSEPAPPRMNYSDDPVVAGALAADLTAATPGPLLGLQLSIEGERLGFLFGYTAAFAPIADTGQSDTLHLALAHITYAFLVTERVRLRAELGGHLAAAPLVAFVAPGAGLSAAVGLAGPVGLEARAFANIWPYTQLDARAGLTLSLAGVGLGAGVRGLYLSDNGVLGEVNAGDTSDAFWGPYFTLAFAL